MLFEKSGKRLFATLIVFGLILSLGFSFVSSGGPQYLLGDANADGVVDVADVIAIMAYLQDPQIYPLGNKLAADYDQNSKVEQADAEALLESLFMSGEADEVSEYASAGSILGPPVGTPQVCSRAFIRGDINNDGMVDVSDSVGALASLFIPGTAPPDCIDRADANDFGIFDVSDAIFMLAAQFVPGAPAIYAPQAPGGYDEEGMGAGTGPTWTMCDGLDNDADGTVDEGEGCPEVDLVVEITYVNVSAASFPIVNLEVSNIGTKALSDNFYISAQIGGAAFQEIEFFAPWLQPPLLPGQTVATLVEFTTFFTPVSGTTYPVTAVVDSQQSIAESDESNNEDVVMWTAP